MYIRIAQRLRPFCHLPGTYCVLPGSDLRLQLFPCLIRVHDLSTSTPEFITEISLNIQGPVEDFTVLQDLEKGILIVWGHTPKGFFRYRLHAIEKSKSISIVVEKTPLDGIQWNASHSYSLFVEKNHSWTNLEKPSQAQDVLWLTDNFSEIKNRPVFQPKGTDRLSLGSHKAMDWELMRRRKSLLEIFPLWIRLGQMVPFFPPHEEGTAGLIKECRQVLQKKRSDQFLAPFFHLFLTSFDSMLSPRLFDHDYQGILLTSSSPKKEASPLILLSEGAKLIRKLFFDVSEQEKEILILPALPHAFHCGRFLHLQTFAGFLDMEWSRKTIRRMIFMAERDEQIQFSFQPEVHQYRLREGNRDRGKIFNCSSPIEVKKGNIYFFDNFRK